MNIRIAHGSFIFTILMLIGVYEVCNPGIKILASGVNLPSSSVLAALLSLFYLLSLAGLNKRFVDLTHRGINLSICTLFLILTMLPIWLMVLLVFFIYANNFEQASSTALFFGFLVPNLMFRIWFEDWIKKKL
jgi:hypothetical protein